MRSRSRIVVRLAQKERQGQTYWLLRWSGPGLEPDETESRERALAVGFVTKREAETRRRAVEAEVNAAFRGLLVSSSSSRAAPSVSRALDDYIVHIATQRGESDYTRAEARISGHLTRLIGHVRADLVTPQEQRLIERQVDGIDAQIQHLFNEGPPEIRTCSAPICDACALLIGEDEHLCAACAAPFLARRAKDAKKQAMLMARGPGVLPADGWIVWGKVAHHLRKPDDVAAACKRLVRPGWRPARDERRCKGCAR